MSEMTKMVLTVLYCVGLVCISIMIIVASVFLFLGNQILLAFILFGASGILMLICAIIDFAVEGNINHVCWIGGAILVMMSIVFFFGILA